MDVRSIITNWIDEHSEELLSLLADLIRARSVNPPGNEREAAEVLAAYFRKHAIPYDIIESEPGRANIIGKVGDGGQSLFIPGHLDTVPAGDGWTFPPFDATVRDGVVYGRGTSDNKGPMAAVMLAAACIQHCVPLAGTLLVGGVADEETGSAKGLEWLMANGKVKPDMAIVPDIGGNMEKIDVAEKGVMVVEITSHGRQAHGSRPEKGVNAIWNLVALLNAFREKGLPDASHPLLSPPTYNLGKISGGTAPNVVPSRADATLDFRFLPGQTDAQLMSWVQEIADEITRKIPGAKFDIATTHALPATELDPATPLVRVLQETTREIAGRDAVLFGSGGVTVTKQMVMRGIPAVAFGAGDSDQAHMQDEHISVEELVTFAKVIALSSVRLLGTKSE